MTFDASGLGIFALQIVEGVLSNLLYDAGKNALWKRPRSDIEAAVRKELDKRHIEAKVEVLEAVMHDLVTFIGASDLFDLEGGDVRVKAGYEPGQKASRGDLKKLEGELRVDIKRRQAALGDSPPATGWCKYALEFYFGYPEGWFELTDHPPVTPGRHNVPIIASVGNYGSPKDGPMDINPSISVNLLGPMTDSEVRELHSKPRLIEGMHKAQGRRVITQPTLTTLAYEKAVVSEYADPPGTTMTVTRQIIVARRRIGFVLHYNANPSEYADYLPGFNTATSTWTWLN